MVYFKIWLSYLWMEKTSEVPLLKFKVSAYRTAVSKTNKQKARHPSRWQTRVVEKRLYWGLHLFISLFIIEQRKSGLRSRSKKTSENGCKDVLV